MTDFSRWADGDERLARPWHGRMVAGVAAGVARYLDVDVTIVRIALVVLACLGVGVPAYLAAWLLVPNEGEEESAAEHWLHAHSHQHV
ncbi:MAG: PspC domain-containing protein [Acidimicrobiales bacterium]